MESILTGLGLFDREATPKNPQPVAVAVNLNLRASVPQVGRPWACRVAAKLIRPGVDGLAQDVRDIERLAGLGQALVKRLGDRIVFAAAVTTGGTRTWLIYAAGTDVTELTAKIRSDVRLTFAEQADYVPSVAVELDHGWAGYLDLCPTAAEARDIAGRRAAAAAIAAADRNTRSAVHRLRAAGTDLTRPVSVRYGLAFAMGTVPVGFLDRVAAAGFRLEPAAHADAGGPPAGLVLVREGPPDAASVHHLERWLIGQAHRSGGQYLGWSVAGLNATAA